MVIWINGLGVENWRNLWVTSLGKSSALFTVQLYLRTGRPAELRNLRSQTCIQLTMVYTTYTGEGSLLWSPTIAVHRIDAPAKDILGLHLSWLICSTSRPKTIRNVDLQTSVTQHRLLDSDDIIMRIYSVRRTVCPVYKYHYNSVFRLFFVLHCQKRKIPPPFQEFLR